MSDGNIFKIDVQCKVDTMDPSLSKVASPHNCCNAQKVHSWVAMFVWLSRVEGSISTQLLQCTKGTSWVAMFVWLSRVEGSISLRLLQHERTMFKRQTYLFAPCWLHSTGQGSGVTKVAIQMWLLGNQHSLDFIDRSASSAVKLRVVTPPPRLGEEDSWT